MLNIGLKRIGFQTAEDGEDVRVDEDKKNNTITTYFDIFCCEIDRRIPGKYIRETNTYKFNSVREQQCVLDLFAKARVIQSPMPWLDDPGELYAKYTHQLLRRIADGEFLS